MFSSPLSPKVKLNIKYNRLTGGFILQSKTEALHSHLLHPQGEKCPTGTEMERGSASLTTSHNMLLAEHNPSWTLLEAAL